MHYSIEPRNRIYVKGYGFISFAKNIGLHSSKKYNQKLPNSAKNLQQMQYKLPQREDLEKCISNW